MGEEKLRLAMARCEEVLREQWAREGRQGPPEKRMRYTVSFTCTPSVFARILQFVREQPTGSRSFRQYEIGSKEDG